MSLFLTTASTQPDLPGEPTAISGQEIAGLLLKETTAAVIDRESIPTLHIFVDPANEVSTKYVNYKQRVASQVGIATKLHHLSPPLTSNDLIANIQAVTTDPQARVIVQLPLPDQMDQNQVLSAIPLWADVDVLNRQATVHPYPQPVAKAVKLALEYAGYNELTLQNMDTAAIQVVGQGFLVGQPVIRWLQSLSINPPAHQDGDDLRALLKAKIIISGAGVANLIQPEYLRPGVVLIDAGTSSDSGEIAGDIDPACYKLASYYTPVPGGIGPITLAVLLNNCVAY